MAGKFGGILVEETTKSRFGGIPVLDEETAIPKATTMHEIDTMSVPLEQQDLSMRDKEIDFIPTDKEEGIFRQSFDPEGEGYDYETAKKYGIKPDETGHWQSRVPETGQILKGRKHKTFNLTEKGESDAGYEIYKGEDGKYYSKKKERPERIKPDRSGIDEYNLSKQNEAEELEQFKTKMRATGFDPQRKVTDEQYKKILENNKSNKGYVEELKTARKIGKLQTELGQIKGQKIFEGISTPESLQREKEIKDELKQITPDKKRKWYDPKQILLGTAELTPLMEQSIVEGSKYGVAGALGAGSVASISGVGSLPIAGLGYAIGQIYGSAKFMAYAEGGLAYDEMKDLGIDDKTAIPIAQGVGIINSGIEMMQLGMVLKTIPGLKGLLTKGVKTVSKKTIPMVLAKAGIDYTKFLAGELGQEEAQEAVTILGTEFAKDINNRLEDTNIPQAKRDEIINRLEETFKGSLGLMVLGIPGTSAQVISDIQQVQINKETKRLQEDLAEILGETPEPLPVTEVTPETPAPEAPVLAEGIEEQSSEEVTQEELADNTVTEITDKLNSIDQAVADRNFTEADRIEKEITDAIKQDKDKFRKLLKDNPDLVSRSEEVFGRLDEAKKSMSKIEKLVQEDKKPVADKIEATEKVVEEEFKSEQPVVEEDEVEKYGTVGNFKKTKYGTTLIVDDKIDLISDRMRGEYLLTPAEKIETEDLSKAKSDKLSQENDYVYVKETPEHLILTEKWTKGSKEGLRKKYKDDSSETILKELTPRFKKVGDVLGLQFISHTLEGNDSVVIFKKVKSQPLKSPDLNPETTQTVKEPTSTEKVSEKKDLIPSLEKEAKKYKSAEEFMEAQELVYHGSDVEITEYVPTANKRGISDKEVKNDVYFFSEDKDVANKFAEDRSGKKNGGVVNEAMLNIDNTLDLTNPETATQFIKENLLTKEERNGLSDEQILDVEQIWSYLDEKIYVDRIKSLGYDSVRLAEPDTIKNGATSIAILDKSRIKTKQQLTDIWNKANETTQKTTQKPQMETTEQIKYVRTSEGVFKVESENDNTWTLSNGKKANKSAKGNRETTQQDFARYNKLKGQKREKSIPTKGIDWKAFPALDLLRKSQTSDIEFKGRKVGIKNLYKETAPDIDKVIEEIDREENFQRYYARKEITTQEFKDLVESEIDDLYNKVERSATAEDYEAREAKRLEEEQKALSQYEEFVNKNIQGTTKTNESELDVGDKVTFVDPDTGKKHTGVVLKQDMEGTLIQNNVTEKVDAFGFLYTTKIEKATKAEIKEKKEEYDEGIIPELDNETARIGREGSKKFVQDDMFAEEQKESKQKQLPPDELKNLIAKKVKAIKTGGKNYSEIKKLKQQAETEARKELEEKYYGIEIDFKEKPKIKNRLNSFKDLNAPYIMEEGMYRDKKRYTDEAYKMKEDFWYKSDESNQYFRWGVELENGTKMTYDGYMRKYMPKQWEKIKKESHGNKAKTVALAMQKTMSEEEWIEFIGENIPFDQIEIIEQTPTPKQFMQIKSYWKKTDNILYSLRNSNKLDGIIDYAFRKVAEPILIEKYSKDIDNAIQNRNEKKANEILDKLDKRYFLNENKSAVSEAKKESLNKMFDAFNKKEIWEITINEYLKDKKGADEISIAKIGHAKAVKDAVLSGKDVPIDVLKNYKSGWAVKALEKKEKPTVEDKVEKKAPTVKAEKITEDNVEDTTQSKAKKLFSGKVNFETRKGLNRSNKKIPTELVNQIETDGVTVEQLDKLDVPVFKYETQITIHGEFDIETNGRIGGYKNLFQNKNKSLGVRYTAIDVNKKNKIRKMLNLAQRYDRVKKSKKDVFGYHKDSKGSSVYIYKIFDSIKEANEKGMPVVKEIFNKTPNNYIGSKYIQAFQSYGRIYLGVEIDLKGIYEKDVDSFIAFATDGLIKSEKDADKINKYFQRYDDVTDRLIDARYKRKQRKNQQKINTFKEKSPYTKYEKLPENIDFKYGITRLDYNDNPKVVVFEVTKDRGKWYRKKIGETNSWEEVDAVKADSYEKRKQFTKADIRSLEKNIAKGIIFNLEFPTKDTKQQKVSKPDSKLLPTQPTGSKIESVKDVVTSETVIPKEGKPFKFAYIRNLEKSPNFGSRFGQDVEPAGKYMVVGKTELPNYEKGIIEFKNPLVIDFGGNYQEDSNWKRVLSKRYGNKKGIALTKAIQKDGYDGIVTISKSGKTKYTSEILDLSVIEPKAKYRTAYHGTPHQFDKFSMTAIGSGEGAQAFGYGLYFTDKKGIAEFYADSLRPTLDDSRGNELRKYLSNNIKSDYSLPDGLFSELYSARFHRKDFLYTEETREISKKETIDWINLERKKINKLTKNRNLTERQKQYKKDAYTVLDRAEAYVNDENVYRPKTNIVEVNIWKNGNEDLLDWENTITFSQSEKIQKQADKENINIGRLTSEYYIEKKLNDLSMKLSGQATYIELVTRLRTQQEASAFLQRAGIDGIKYKAEGGKSEAYNYVVFDENAIEIVNKEQFREAISTPNTNITEAEKKRIIRLNKSIFGDDWLRIIPEISENRTALGKYQGGWIDIVSNRANPKDTFLHEAVHKAEDLFLSDKELSELKKAMPDAEKRAETIIDYQNGNKTLTGKIKRIVDKLLRAIRRLFGKARNIDKIYDFYDRLMSGYYAQQEVTTAELQPAMYSLIGEKGAKALDSLDEATTRMDNLGIARKMEIAKKTAKEIRLATGWEKGKDGKWRYEIPDGKIDLNNVERIGMYENKYKISLGDLYKNKELFNAYPELKEIEVVIDGSLSINRGFYVDQKITIGGNIDFRFEELAMNTLVHEIQHSIQDIEGFAKGGNQQQFKVTKDIVDEQKKELEFLNKTLILSNMRDNKINKEEAFSRYKKNYGEDVPETVELYLLQMNTDDIKKAISETKEFIKNGTTSGYEQYRKLAGEVEARNASNRMNMTQEERLQTLLETTEDIAREDQIVIQDAINGMANFRRNTDTKEFKNWFGKSKVVDENGEPLVVYHGSGSKFNIFDKSKAGGSNSIADIGFWFTPERLFAENFAKDIFYGDGRDNVVYDVYLSMQNPKIYETTGKVDNNIPEEMRILEEQREVIFRDYYDDVWAKQALEIVAYQGGFQTPKIKKYYENRSPRSKSAVKDGKKVAELNKKLDILQNKADELLFQDAYEKLKTDIYKFEGMGARKANIGGLGMMLKSPKETKAKFLKDLKKQGYDGIIIKNTRYDAKYGSGNNDQYIAFQPTQIKSIYNTGTFDPTNPDIRYRDLNDILKEDEKKVGKLPDIDGKIRVTQEWMGDLLKEMETELSKSQKQSIEETYRIAKETGKNPDALVEETLSTGEPIADKEIILLFKPFAELNRQRDALAVKLYKTKDAKEQEKITKQIGEISNKIDRYANAIRIKSSSAGRTLQSFKTLIDKADLTFSNMMRRVEQIVKRPLTNAEMKEIAEITAKYEELKKDYDTMKENYNKAIEKEVEKEVKRQIAEYEKKQSKKKQKKEKSQGEIDKLKKKEKDILAKFEKLGIAVNYDIIGLTVETTKLISELAGVEIELGAKTFEDVINNIGEKLPYTKQQIIYAISERSKKAIRKKPSEARMKRKEIRKIATALVDLENLEKKGKIVKQPTNPDPKIQNAYLDKLLAEIKAKKKVIERIADSGMNAMNNDDERIKLQKALDRVYKIISQREDDVKNAQQGIFIEKEVKKEVPKELLEARQKLRELNKELAKLKREEIKRNLTKEDERKKLLERIKAYKERIESLKDYQGKKADPFEAENLDLKKDLKDLYRILDIKRRTEKMKHAIKTGDYSFFENNTLEELGEFNREIVEARYKMNKQKRIALNYMEEKRGFWTPEVVGEELGNLIRSIKSSGDFMPIMRQGSVAVAGYPRMLAKAVAKEFKTGFSEDAEMRSWAEIEESPYFYQALYAGLDFYDVNSVAFEDKPEFFRSRLLDSKKTLKGLGFGVVKGVSERWFVSYINHIAMRRFEMFMMRNPDATPQDIQAFTELLNTEIGKGNFGKYKRIAPLLAKIGFAPKYELSKWQLPYYMVKHFNKKAVRKEILRDFPAFVISRILFSKVIWGLWLISLMGGERDDDAVIGDYNWGKQLVGNIHADDWGAYLQMTRLISRLVKTGDFSNITEKEKESFWNILNRYFNYKSNPNISTGIALYTNKNIFGQKTTRGKTIVEAFSMMAIRDIVEMIKDDESGMLADVFFGGKALIGGNVQVFSDKKNKDPLDQELKEEKLIDEELED